MQPPMIRLAPKPPSRKAPFLPVRASTIMWIMDILLFVVMYIIFGCNNMDMLVVMYISVVL